MKWSEDEDRYTFYRNDNDDDDVVEQKYEPQPTLEQLVAQQKRIDENNRRISNYIQAMNEQKELRVNATIKDQEREDIDEQIALRVKSGLSYDDIITAYIKREEMKDFYTMRKQK